MAQSSREIYWSAILADFRRSGLTHVQFCDRRRLSIHSFRSWLYRLRPGLPPPRSSRRGTPPPPAADPTEIPTFLPVHVRSGSPSLPADQQVPRPQAPLELVFSDRCLLRVPTGFDPATLHRVLDVLEQRS